jgi:Mrp family chromosome partitioning ATPase
MSLSNFAFRTAAAAIRTRGSEAFEPVVHPRVETGCLLVREPHLRNAPAAPYLTQLAQALSKATAVNAGPRAIALTAANRGDGVTFVCRSLAGALSAHTSEKVLITDAETLGTRNYALDSPEPENPAVGSVFRLKPTGPQQQKTSEARHLSRNLALIGRHFNWIVLDCPPLRESNEALLLAPHTSGIVVVVAAEKTKRSEIAQTQRAIELSSGTLLGFVLNKRTWPVPDFLYHRL